MKKILLIPVGGTICTTLNENQTLSVSEQAGSWLIHNFEHSDSFYAGQVQFDTTENLMILSENMTVEKWNLMLETYRTHIGQDVYDSVIFAHGTDTLAYSASLFSMILSGTRIPVFFVSANARLDSEWSNGNDNFRCAVECICREIPPNVYAVYRNLSDGKMYLHLASRLEQCRNYSEDFYSVGAVDISDIGELNYAGYFKKLEQEYPQEKIKALPEVRCLSECVLQLQPYVGMNYDAYDYSRFRAVLHGTYHSGTACSEKTGDRITYGKNSILHMIDLCAESGTVAYFSPSKRTGEIYETVGIIGNHKPESGDRIAFLYGYTNELAYTKLVLAYSLFENPQDIRAFLSTEYNFEIIDEG